jgi:outer membrane protein TolC
MRLTTLLGLTVWLSCLATYGQESNQVRITGYPAQKVVALSLTDAVRLALQNNLGLQLERYNPTIVRYDVRGLYGAAYDPVFTAQALRANTTREGGTFSALINQEIPGSLNRNDSLNTTLAGNLPTGMRYELYGNIAENRNTHFSLQGVPGTNFLVKERTDQFDASAGIRVAQPLLRNFWTDSGRTAIKLRKQDQKIANLDLETRAHTVVYDVISAYYDLLGNLESIKVAEADLQVKRQNSDETRKKIEVGTLAALDEKKADSDVAIAENTLIEAQDARADTEARLKGLLYSDYVSELGTRIEPTDKLLIMPTLIDMPTSFRTAMERRPELQAQRNLLERRNIQIKFTYNQLFPQLDVIANWGVVGLDRDRLEGALRDLSNTAFEQDGWGALFSVPLWRERERNAHKIAKLQKEQEVLRVKALADTIASDVDTAVRAVVSARKRIDTNQRAVASAEADLDAERKKFQAGKSTSFFVLEASSRLAAARNQYIQAIVEYNRAIHQLSRAEGTILEENQIDLDDVQFGPGKP